MASGLLVLLLLVNSGLAPAVLGSEDCWVDDRVDDVVCTKTDRCRRSCVGHGFEDGRCQWGFPDLLPYCQCRRSDCHTKATGASD
ncbi:hypothetical protein HU200_024227 [Digitaria exilis]|uniref:Defensin n=1 Tax=Digitaria exilis TaxID=1010633 RepID=A0A835C6S3_9POAL|nr:hypothetical protein HU200_024227 [Digitaria exilis]CAB3461206.1 unnamed protein product [Digitaria exilis]